METGLSLGSNIGDRLEMLREARRRVAAIPDVRVVAQSRVYETRPVDVAAEYESLLFLNAVLIVESRQPLRELAAQLHGIEADLGRVRDRDRNSPRPIDLDIVYAGGARVSERDLTVPHPRWAERWFGAQPLADVRPNLLLPGQTKTVAQILRSLPGPEGVRPFAETW